MNLELYLTEKTDNIFNLLILKEAELKGEHTYIDSHIDSLVSDIEGAAKTFPVLGDSVDYIVVINLLRNLKSEIEYKTYRKRILRMCNLLNRVKDIYASGGDEK